MDSSGNMTCEHDQELFELLMDVGLVVNTSSAHSICAPPYNNTLDDIDLNILRAGQYSHNRTYGGNYFYAFATPFIIAIGLTGNMISLRVFTSTRLRKLSASLYLIALSSSDTVVLLTYVLFDWLMKGLPRWPAGHQVNALNVNGVCHGFLFVSYMFRFISVYLIIIFTIERYIAVCRPLQRRIICTKAFAKKIIASVHAIGALISIYKPVLSGVYPAHRSAALQRNGNATLDNEDYILNAVSSAKICTRNPNYVHINFVMDVLYGLSITAIPFLMVTVFNFLMLRKLVNRHILSGQMRAVFKESKMRIEFTITVIAVSTCFVCLNIPYFVVWVQQFLQSVNPEDSDVAHKNSEYMNITRTIFSMNYGINFFVYCLTGTYYRGIITNLFRCRKSSSHGYHNSALHSSGGLSHTHHTELRALNDK